MQAQRERESSLVDALSRVLEAGQRVLIDRVELALAETRSGLHALLGDATLAAGAVLFLLLPAWLSVLALAALWLGERWSLQTALAVLGLLQLALGTALLAWAVRRRAASPLRREVP